MSAASVRATQGLCCLLTDDGLLATRRRRATTDDRVDAADRLVKSVTRKHICVGNARRIVHHERHKRCAFRPRPEAAKSYTPEGREAAGLRTRHRKGVAWPGLAVLGGSGEGPGGTWCMEDGTTSAGSMRFRQSHLLTPTAHLGHPPTPTRVRWWRRAVRQAARRRCVSGVHGPRSRGAQRCCRHSGTVEGAPGVMCTLKTVPGSAGDPGLSAVKRDLV